MNRSTQSINQEVTAIISPFENKDHPDHPEHTPAKLDWLLASMIKGTPLLVGAAVASGCLYVGLNDPESKQIFPTCGFYAMTGMYCPGCGMTRALHNLLGGNVLRAIRYNLLLVAAIPLLMYAYIWWTTWAFTKRELPKLKFSHKTVWLLCGLGLVFIVGRNFPGAIPQYFALGK